MQIALPENKKRDCPVYSPHPAHGDFLIIPKFHPKVNPANRGSTCGSPNLSLWRQRFPSLLRTLPLNFH